MVVRLYEWMYAVVRAEFVWVGLYREMYALGCGWV